MSKRFIEQSCLPKVMEEVWSTIGAIKSMGGSPFDPHEHLQRLSCNIVYRLTYGIRFKAEDIGKKESHWGELHDVINSIKRLGGQNVMANYSPVLKLMENLKSSG